jgi:hypothetical protein
MEAASPARAPDDGIVADDHAGENTPDLALGYGVEEFVLESPDGATAHPHLALDGQCGDSLLVLDNQILGSKPLGQRWSGLPSSVPPEV